jgi:hypothetical protein
MFRAFRSLLIALVAISLIYSPLFVLNTRASGASSRDARKSPPPQQLAEHEPRVLLVRFLAASPIGHQDFILRSVAQTYKRLRGGVVEITLHDALDFDAVLNNLRKLEGAIEWVEPNYIVQRTGDVRASARLVVQHDAAYGLSFTQRGNLTSVVQSSVVNGAVAATRTVKRLSYDTTGNLRAEADGAANRRQILYTDNYTNKPGGVGQTQIHPYTVADPTGFRSGSQWNYYTGQTIKTFNLLAGSSTEQQVVTTSYDFVDRPVETIQPNGGWVKTAYWDNWLAVASSQLAGGCKHTNSASHLHLHKFRFVTMNGFPYGRSITGFPVRGRNSP